MRKLLLLVIVVVLVLALSAPVGVQGYGTGGLTLGAALGTCMTPTAGLTTARARARTCAA